MFLKTYLVMHFNNILISTTYKDEALEYASKKKRQKLKGIYIKIKLNTKGKQ